MATPTKKTGLKKVPPAVWIVGGIGVLGLGYYYYKKKKEESSTTVPNTTYSEEELKNQSFIPVVSTTQSGAGAVYYPREEPQGNSINTQILEFMKEQSETQSQSNKENHEAMENYEKENQANQASLLQTLLSGFKESQSESRAAVVESQSRATQSFDEVLQQQQENLNRYLETTKSLTGGGAPGTTDNGANTTGGSPTPTVVGTTQAASTTVSNLTKALFGGRTIVHPNEPDSYIVAASGSHCPNSEWNRDHPKQMRGCS